MKKFLLYVCLLLLLFSCSKNNEPIGENVIVAGKIAIPLNQVIKIVRHNIYDYLSEEEADSVNLNDDGTFRFALRLNKPTVFYLSNGSDIVLWELYVVPGDSINVVINDSNPDKYSYKFNGKGKSVYGNRIHQLFKETFPKDDEFWKNVYSDNYKQFIQFIDTRRKNQFEFYKKYLWKNDAPLVVKNDVMDEINYIWGYCRANYLLTRYYWTDDKKFKIDSTYFLFLREIPLDNPKSQFRLDFPTFVSRYLDLLVAESEDKTKDTTNKDELKASKEKYQISKLMFSGLARDIAMSEAIQSMIEWHPTLVAMKIVSGWLDEFKRIAYDTGYVNPILTKYNQRLGLMPGKPAPNFTLEDVNGNKVSLSDFRGKVVYIDFWGTWCGPCLQELPFYKALQEKFNGNNNIVFLSLALEYKRHDEWIQFVKEKNLPGVHLYLERQFLNSVAQKYMIRGVPTFVLIGKDGKIIDANAKRPSQPELENELKKYLN